MERISVGMPSDRLALSGTKESTLCFFPARASTLTLAANGDYALDPDAVHGVFSLVLEDGASLDLGGETLVVRRFTGDRSAVDGEIVETNPLKGLRILVR